MIAIFGNILMVIASWTILFFISNVFNKNLSFWR